MEENSLKLTVSELTGMLKSTIEECFTNITVEGEISGFRPSSTGHWYFTLKDKSSAISAVIWKSQAWKLDYRPKDGDRVVARGNISVYEARGTYQIVCYDIHPVGTGDILQMLEERKRAYNKAGYFDAERKKKIPERPERIVLITSPTGAALQDILRVLGRRNSGIDIIILPAVVQGDNAASTIAKRIEEANKFLLGDVIIVGRGGGSIEDLLPFSDELVVETIYNSDIPVISAVGHEIDWALSDYVADVRAATPSAAAELVCAKDEEQRAQIEVYKQTMRQEMLKKLNSIKLLTTAFSMDRFKSNLDNRISKIRMDNEGARHNLEINLHNLFNSKVTISTSLKNQLIALSPLSILDRGYSIVRLDNKKVLKNSKDAPKGENLSIKLAKGTIKAVSTGE